MDRPVVETSDNTQQSQQTDIHVPSEIRTRYASKRSAADPLLRQLGHYPLPVSRLKKEYSYNYTPSVT